MAQNELEEEINTLANYPESPRSQWVDLVTNSSPEVISGALLYWSASGVSSGDKNVNKRDAAKAILDAKLTKEITTTMSSLNTSATRLTIVGLILAVVAIVATVLIGLDLP